MILNISKKTDIPAYYSEWLFNRIKEGYICVRNPVYENKVSKIPITPADVECIVFWTRDPEPVLKRIDELKGYNYYFHITVNGLGEELEPNIQKLFKVIRSFKELSRKIGKEKVIWRYDPVFLTHKIDIEHHLKMFGVLTKELGPHTERVIISFLDSCQNVEEMRNPLGIKSLVGIELDRLLSLIEECSGRYGFRVETCSEELNLEKYKISKGHCIDPILIEKITGIKKEYGRPIDRKLNCGCVESFDPGVQNTCAGGCVYCYANAIEEGVKQKHNPESPFFLGEFKNGDLISIKKY